MKEESYCIRTYYQPNKYAMSLIGQWPYQSESIAKFIIFFWAFQHVSILLPELIRLVEIRNNIDYVMQAFSPIIYNFVVAIKFANGVINRHKVKATFDVIQQDWKSLINEEEKRILSKYTSFGKLLAVGYIFMCAGTVFCYLLFPLTPFFLDVIKPLNESRPKEPIYLVEFFVDRDKYFYEILTHSYITSVIGAFPLYAVDAFYAISVQHACGMFFILGGRLEKINKNEELNKKLVEDPYQQTVACAMQHSKILQYCENLNESYSDSFFYVMGLTVVSLSFCGVLTILTWGQFYNMIRIGIFAVAQTFHLFCYSLMGQNLTDHSIIISDRIYDSEWYTASLRARKVMAIILMRSSKPFTLTAKLFILSLPTFTMVMKTSMSYFTVLKSTR